MMTDEKLVEILVRSTNIAQIVFSKAEKKKLLGVVDNVAGERPALFIQLVRIAAETILAEEYMLNQTTDIMTTINAGGSGPIHGN